MGKTPFHPEPIQTGDKEGDANGKPSKKNPAFMPTRSILLLVGTLLLARNVQGYAERIDVSEQESGETLIAHFVNGPNGATSQQEYSGTVIITVSGIGQASSTQYSDAFYILTDNDGNPIEPWHATLLYNRVLWINGQHAEDSILDQQVPAYRDDHTYTFEIDAPGGYLAFGVGDVGTGDNTGSYAISIGNSSTCSIPYFSQWNDQWALHPLRTAGGCSVDCNSIGACGCTLTAATMVFAYYGADLTPPTLSDCMGTSACPFGWAMGASCTDGKARWIEKCEFKAPDCHWARLDQELNQNKRPVILGMSQRDNADDTHWVLVTSGCGSTAGDYLIHDPLPLDGADTNLAVYSRQNYASDWLSMMANQSVISHLWPRETR